MLQDGALTTSKPLTRLLAMEIDESSSKTAKSKIGKRRSKRKSSIIFPTYKERQLRRKKRV